MRSRKNFLMNKRSNQPSHIIIKTLKIDIFSIISLATYQNQMVIVRELNNKNKCYKMIAKYLNYNEVKILKKINRLDSPNFSKLIKSTPNYIIRSYISGIPLTQYPGKLSEAFYKKAFELVHTLHRNGIVHNDLEKAENWIVMDNGEPAFIDFQLAKHFSKKTFLFKVLKKIEQRHIIKSKKRFCSSPLSVSELKILNNRSLIHKFSIQYIKPCYNFIIRKLFNYSDRKSDQYLK